MNSSAGFGTLRAVVFRTSATLARRWRQVRHVALVLVSLALAHEAVYAVRPHALPGTGGDAEHRYWLAFLLVALIGCLTLVIGWLWRISRSVLGGPPLATGSDRETQGFVGELRLILGRLAPTVAASYLVLENAEHALAHGHLEGAGVFLAAGSEFTLPVVLAVVTTIAAVGALVRWREVVLIGRLRAGRSRTVRVRRSSPPAPRWSITAALIKHSILLGRDDLGRAPPATTPV